MPQGLKGYYLNYIIMCQWCRSDELDTQADGYTNIWSNAESERFFILVSKVLLCSGYEGHLIYIFFLTVGFIFLNMG